SPVAVFTAVSVTPVRTPPVLSVTVPLRTASCADAMRGTVSTAETSKNRCSKPDHPIVTSSDGPFGHDTHERRDKCVGISPSKKWSDSRAVVHLCQSALSSRPGGGFLMGALRLAVLLTALATLVFPSPPTTALAQTRAASPPAAAKQWAPPRTPWGHPDLQGTYTNKDASGIPMGKAH